MQSISNLRNNNAYKQTTNQINMIFYKDKEQQRVSFPIKRKTLDFFIMSTGALAAVDFIVVPVISQIFTRELKTLHEYLGLPPQMSDTGIGIGMVYGGVAAVYNFMLRKRFLGKKED